ncbi:TetR/AcrR family transcriptional regulator [Pseudoroseomonas cervicalis]|uniref:TetR/AcrR family transcriptional regulator n=1 Tax=Teichococcus cervicalis TaxID=204525 RepID=UPI00278A65B9|nr:TetR/AcrR family transcriptional regulator [Pseudoroseomonas cervicalis]MDQ1080261.1 AcrR family transcriptional regulator [Pseudoroseomonas cervicalis]
MARPRSDARRQAILAAALQVIGAEGPSAPTATIARAAGVSNGSLFTYFPTKADLLNQLYVALKQEMGGVIREALGEEGELHDQMLRMWTRWIGWAVSGPEKRRVLAHLNVCGDITPESREAGLAAMAGLQALVERSRTEGPLRDAPLPFVLGLISAIADATIDAMLREPDQAGRHCAMAGEAAWQMLAAAPVRSAASGVTPPPPG